MTRYYSNYHSAKDDAVEHALSECEYGDTGYMSGDEPISYCAWNKSGERDEEWEVEAYYTWRRGDNDSGSGRLVPVPIDPEWVSRTMGIPLDEIQQ